MIRIENEIYSTFILRLYLCPPKNIEDITQGDKVITHKGNVKKVLYTNKRKHTGKLVNLKIAFSDVLKTKATTK